MTPDQSAGNGGRASNRPLRKRGREGGVGAGQMAEAGQHRGKSDEREKANFQGSRIGTGKNGKKSEARGRTRVDPANPGDDDRVMTGQIKKGPDKRKKIHIRRQT